jgi:hypothetical protein
MQKTPRNRRQKAKSFQWAVGGGLSMQNTNVFRHVFSKEDYSIRFGGLKIGLFLTYMVVHVVRVSVPHHVRGHGFQYPLALEPQRLRGRLCRLYRRRLRHRSGQDQASKGAIAMSYLSRFMRFINGWIETIHLLRSPANAADLRQAIEDVATGRLTEFDPTEDARPPDPK